MVKSAPIPDDCQPLTDAVGRGEVQLVALARGQYPGQRLAKDILPGLRTIGYWDAHGKQTWGLPMHRNEGIEICCLLRGACQFATDETTWNLSPGDVTITRPWQRHRVGNPHIHASKLFWLILDVADDSGTGVWEIPEWVGPDASSRRELLRVFRRNQRNFIPDGEARLRQTIEQGCESLAQPGPFGTAATGALINQVMVSVARILMAETHDSAQDVQGFNQTILQFYRGLEYSVETAAEPWTVDNVARSCRIGVTYLTAACREIFHMTPMEQLNRIRLEHAARLLVKEPATTITRIALRCGFNSSQYFANRFKRHFGRTPGDYRSHHER